MRLLRSITNELWSWWESSEDRPDQILYRLCVCLYTYTWKHSLLALVFVYVNYIFVSYTITILKLTVIKGHYLFCILFVLFLFIPLCVCLFIYRLLLLFFFLYWFLWLYILHYMIYLGFFFRKTDAFWQFVHLFVFMNCHKAVIAPGWGSNYRHHSPQHFPIPPEAFPGYISTPFDTKKQQVYPRGWAVSHCSAI